MKTDQTSLEQLKNKLKQLSSTSATDLQANPDFNAFRSQQLMPLQIAAVLIPLIILNNQAHLLLIKRPLHMPSHPGDLAFPGGKPEPTDSTLQDTAIRETQEELGIERSRIEPLGALPDYISLSGFRIRPYLGWITSPEPLTPSADEVAAVYLPTLDYMMNSANYQLQSRQHEGQQRHFYQIPVEQEVCWGATAGILHHLANQYTHLPS